MIESKNESVKPSSRLGFFVDFESARKTIDPSHAQIKAIEVKSPS
jgi:hypothetical protein